MTCLTYETHGPVAAPAAAVVPAERRDCEPNRAPDDSIRRARFDDDVQAFAFAGADARSFDAGADVTEGPATFQERRQTPFGGRA